MRQFLDCNGTPLRLMGIGGRDAYEGVLEGNAYLARKFRLMTGRNAMKASGVFVVGLDALESEIACRLPYLAGHHSLQSGSVGACGSPLAHLRRL